MGDGIVPAWDKSTGNKNTVVSGSPAAGAMPAEYAETVAYLKSLSDANRKALATSLRAAKFDVPASGSLGFKLISAYSQAQAEMAQWNNLYPGITFSQYLGKRIEEQGGTGGSGGSNRRVSYSKINDTDAAELVGAVMKDTVGRGPTEEELAKYTALIRKAQAKNPTVTTYNGDVSSTSGGVNPQELLIQELSNNDEARANKVLGYYNAFRNLLGVR